MKLGIEYPSIKDADFWQASFCVAGKGDRKMSADEIQQIIRRSVLDRAFAKALRDNFHDAVREYNLTTIEKSALKAMQIEFEDRSKKRRPAKRSARKFVPASKYYRLD